MNSEYISSCRGAKFRTEFAKISEIRSLLPPSTNIVAATATASVETQKKIVRLLEMSDCDIITKIPNKLNIKYVVLPKPDEETFLQPIISNICRHGVKTKRHLVFCRTYDDTLSLFKAAAVELGIHNALYSQPIVPKQEKSKFRLCDKYDACTSKGVKKNITESFTDEDGILRLVFATTAFSMGLDSPNIHFVSHWGPPFDLESYIQESGRGGRDGKPCLAVLYFSKANMKPDYVSVAMKEYCLNEDNRCRREILMKPFMESGTISKPEFQHDCCDVCTSICVCTSCAVELSTCDMESILQDFESTSPMVHQDSIASNTSSHVTASKKEQSKVRDKLFLFREELCSKYPASEIVGIELCTGLSDATIKLIAKKFKSVRSTTDLVELGVPSTELAQQILTIL